MCGFVLVLPQSYGTRYTPGFWVSDHLTCSTSGLALLRSSWKPPTLLRYEIKNIDGTFYILVMNEKDWRNIANCWSFGLLVSSCSWHIELLVIWKIMLFVSEMDLQRDLQFRVPDAAQHHCWSHIQWFVAVSSGEFAHTWCIVCVGYCTGLTLCVCVF